MKAYKKSKISQTFVKLFIKNKWIKYKFNCIEFAELQLKVGKKEIDYKEVQFLNENNQFEFIRPDGMTDSGIKTINKIRFD